MENFRRDFWNNLRTSLLKNHKEFLELFEKYLDLFWDGCYVLEHLGEFYKKNPERLHVFPELFLEELSEERLEELFIF